MTTCAETRVHLFTHGNRDGVAVYQHVSTCARCAPVADAVLELEGRLRALRRVSIPDGLAERLLERPELAETVSVPEASVRFGEAVSSARPWSTGAWSAAAHAACLLVGVALANQPTSPDVPKHPPVAIRFYLPGPSGPGGGGGGGGEHGSAPSVSSPAAEPARASAPRVAPRGPRALSFDELSAPELPSDAGSLLDDVFSPDASTPRWDPTVSAGTLGGMGGGEGSGVGAGRGWGVGPGRGGGFGGGDYRPGSWDIDPVLVQKGADPIYPPAARAQRITGEVVLQIRVRLDGTTEVLRVLKSLPYCVDAAIDSARQYRWKPALNRGQPVEAVGVIFVKFELLPEGR